MAARISPIALICSVPLEAGPLVRTMTGTSEVSIGRRTGYDGLLGAVPVVLVIGGMGKTNSAQSLTALLESRHPRAIVGFGVAGAYADSGLTVGGLALASAESYADEGVETPDGWISTRGIGIPLLARSGEEPLFNDFPVDPRLLHSATNALSRAGLAWREGPFATVSCCSGTSERGAAIASRTSAICETMEGAAYAHVAALYGVPFLGVRGISNMVENRDPARWKLQEAAETAAAALTSIVPAL